MSITDPYYMQVANKKVSDLLGTTAKLTSVMIIITGASLSEQHTDLLIYHCAKQDFSRTSRDLGLTYDKPTARTAIVSVSTYMHELSFTLKS